MAQSGASHGGRSRGRVQGWHWTVRDIAHQRKWFTDGSWTGARVAFMEWVANPGGVIVPAGDRGLQAAALRKTAHLSSSGHGGDVVAVEQVTR